MAGADRGYQAARNRVSVNLTAMMRASARCLMLLLILAACWNGLPGVSSPPAAHALDDAERLWTVGARAFEDGLYDLSIRMLDRLVDRFPSDPHVGEASLLIGQARLSQKAFQPALDAFRRAQGVTPSPGQPGEARFWEAETLFRMKRFADARDLYERVVAEHETSPVAAGRALWPGVERSRAQEARRCGRRFPPVPLRLPRASVGAVGNLLPGAHARRSQAAGRSGRASPGLSHQVSGPSPGARLALSPRPGAPRLGRQQGRAERAARVRRQLPQPRSRAPGPSPRRRRRHEEGEQGGAG